MRAGAAIALVGVLAGCDDASALATRDAGTGPSPFDFDAGCNGPIIPGASLTCAMEVSGQVRRLLLYAPPSYDPTRPSPLVVDAHGAGENAAEQAGTAPYRNWPAGLGSGFRLVADREGFLVVEPEGFGDGWVADDATFILQIPALVTARATVDPRRVFLTGISNGGQLVFWVGCQDQGTFRAFAPISASNIDPCPLPRPAPLIQFHTPDDVVIPIDAGVAAFATWASASHCRAGSSPSWQFGGAGGDPRSVCLAPGSAPAWTLVSCDAGAPATTCALSSDCDDGTSMFCRVPADTTFDYAVTGGHVLYVNGTSLALAAVTWEFWKALP